VGFGDGVYVSADGGKSFKNVGLKESMHIAKILVDPRDSATVYVAAQGPLWSGGGERGLYKTTNGGKTWEQILAKGEYTGVTDVVFDPRNPDVIYAATHQRQRTVWALVNGGPESGIFKSTDGGAHWEELKKGLPGEDKGKIALGVSPMAPDIVYASIELAGRKGGFWRSTDAGASWDKMSDYISGGTGPHYYQEMFVDPHHLETIYQANVQLGRSEDDGKTWSSVGNSSKHVDNHAVAFHPTDPDFLLVGCDGGLYRSYDRGRTYQFVPNLPLTQFYKVDVDYDYPFYNIVGGTQDNSTQYGPSRTGNSSGIRNSDWWSIIGGDGHDCAIDPEDPNIIYCESQQGFLRRYDRKVGESIGIQPRPEKGEEDLRFNWDSPIHISPHSHTRVYHGSKKLHKSEDRGDSWVAISPDLSRGRERYKLPLMGRVWSVDAIYDTYAMSRYGNITSISESPVVEGLIYVGTDDGLVQVTEDGGGSWRKIDQFYGVPEYSFVNDVKADLYDGDTVYAALDNHKTGDFKPYLIRSRDRGRTWTSITGDLPDRHLVWRFNQDHVKKDLFFLGTEFGLFFSLNEGTNWIKLNGGVPMIPFRDVEIQRRESDLVGASFGRGFFILDDYSFLRHLSAEALKENELSLFPVRKALLYVEARTLGGGKGSQGDGFYMADNPPFGAAFTYYLRDALKSKKQKRREEEGKVKKQGGDIEFPGWEELKAEAREEGPVLFFTIKDGAGNVVNRVTGPSSAGLHRVNWNLRYASETSPRGSGVFVVPGTYTVSAAKRVDDETVALGGEQTFEVVAIGEPAIPAQDREEVLAYYKKVEELRRAAGGASQKVGEVLGQVEAMKAAVRGSSNVDLGLLDEVRALELKLLDAREALTGDPTKPNLNEPGVPSILDRANNARSGWSSTHGPTGTQRKDYEIALEEYGEVVGEIKPLVETELAALQAKLEEAGVVWTTGRPLPVLK